MDFFLSSTPIDVRGARAALLDLGSGGYVAFEGWVRNHHLGKDVIELHYEAYPGLALKTGEAIVREAITTYSLRNACAIHRTGRLFPGDLAVWVGVAAAHRAEAFTACRAIIDQIKAEVPIWKHEFYADGTSEWVNPADCHCADVPPQP